MTTDKLIIRRGPLTANHGDFVEGRLKLTPGKAMPVGLQLEPTGRTHGVWTEARTPWQIEHGGSAWFHGDYLGKPARPSQSGPTVADVLAGWVADVEGVALDVDGRYGVQCVDGVKDWARAIAGRDPARAAGNGRDVAGRLIAEGWEDVNRALIRGGDIVSFAEPYGKSPRTRIYYGHVGVALGEPQGGKVLLLDQDGFRDSVMHRSAFPIEHVSRVARPPAPPAPAGAQDRTHTVAAGDTLWSVSRAYGISLGALQALNPGVSARDLRVGQTLTVAR